MHKKELVNEYFQEKKNKNATTIIELSLFPSMYRHKSSQKKPNQKNLLLLLHTHTLCIKQQIIISFRSNY